MFNFTNRSRPLYPTIRRALIEAGLAHAGDPMRVAVLEDAGQYSGRRVKYFRAFEPEHQQLLLAAGHVERNGAVVVYTRPGPEGAVPTRQPADRAKHADYERLMSWDVDEAARVAAGSS